MRWSSATMDALVHRGCRAVAVVPVEFNGLHAAPPNKSEDDSLEPAIGITGRAVALLSRPLARALSGDLHPYSNVHPPSWGGSSARSSSGLTGQSKRF